MRRDRSRGHWFWWLLPCLVVGQVAAQAPATLGAAVAVVRQMPLPSQQAFAQLALDHLIERFRTELRHTPGKAAGWQRGTGGYLGQLESMRAALDGDAPVRFLGGPRGAFRLLVGSRQAMLQTPRDAVQPAFERALVDDWCAMTECANPAATVPFPQLAAGAPPAASGARGESADGTAAVQPASSSAASEARASILPAEPEPPPRPIGPPANPVALATLPVQEEPPPKAPATMPRPGTWQFSDESGPTYASEDGLQCVYGDSRHLKLKQASCTAVMQDLRRVVAGLRAAAARGGAIDWGALRLEPRGLGSPAHLSVGSAGPGFEADVPHLAAAPELLQLLAPWLQARVRGQALVSQVELPDQLNYLESSLRGAP